MPEVVITRLGAQGDGVAETAEGPVHIAGTLPGERVEAEIAGTRGRLGRIVSASAERMLPACRHFGSCGGCKLQHMAPPAYLAFKRAAVARALAQRGIDMEPQPVIAIPPASRRRVTLSARRTRKSVVLGFHGLSSAEIVPVEHCPIAVPRIDEALEGLRALVAPLLTNRKSVV